MHNNTATEISTASGEAPASNMQQNNFEKSFLIRHYIDGLVQNSNNSNDIIQHCGLCLLDPDMTQNGPVYQ